MAENVYEGMFILDSNRYGRDAETISGQIPQIIENAGGEMLVSRLWEERRLAYPIEGHRKGTYWLTYFRLDSAKLVDVRRRCQLSESIVRVMFLKVDPRIVDALVDHAQVGTGSITKRGEGETPAGEPEESAAEAVAAAAEEEDHDPSSPDMEG